MQLFPDRLLIVLSIALLPVIYGTNFQCVDVLSLKRPEAQPLLRLVSATLNQGRPSGRLNPEIVSLVEDRVANARTFMLDRQARIEMNMHTELQEVRHRLRDGRPAATPKLMRGEELSLQNFTDPDLGAVLVAMHEKALNHKRHDTDFITQFFGLDINRSDIYTALAEVIAAKPRRYMLVESRINEKSDQPEIVGFADLRFGDEVYSVRFSVETHEDPGVHVPVLTFLAPRLGFNHTNDGLGVFISAQRKVLLIRGFTKGQPRSAWTFDMNRVWELYGRLTP